MKIKWMRLLLSVLLVFVMTSIMAVAIQAETTRDFTVTGDVVEGTDYTYVDNVLTVIKAIGSSRNFTISGTTSTDRIVVQKSTTYITLDNVHIESSTNSAVEIQGKTVITLVGDNTLDCSNGSAPGLEVMADITLTIEGEGSLTAIGGTNSAGIGGGEDAEVGKITISSGTITATGGDNGAGIGGGANAVVNTIKINSEDIVATGGTNAAGIGGGANATVGEITISSTGTIVAIGGDDGAGIGSGQNGTGGSITITKGNITAIGGGSGAGIGCGSGGEGGTFATGTNNRYTFIVTNSITDKSKISNWEGIIFQGDDGKIYNASEPSYFNINAVIPAGKTLTIDSTQNFTISSGGTLTNEGTITNHGTFKTLSDSAGGLINNGTLNNDGTIENQGTITSSGTLNSTGVFTNGSNGTFIDSGIFENSGTFTNKGFYKDHEIEYHGDIGVAGGIFETDYSYSSTLLKILTDTPLVLTGTTTDDHVTVEEGVNANLTLNNLNIDVSGVVTTNANIAVWIKGTANITLLGSNILKSGDWRAGLEVEDTASVTIDGTGSLDVYSRCGSAGIGGGEGGDSGTIIINGGTINAYGSDGAGIGGGQNGNNSTITINGGTVNAYGGEKAAGIGGGMSGYGGTIVINGGTVNAVGGIYAAGIGGGSSDYGGNITITGGTVTATGGNSSAGIGDGSRSGSGGAGDSSIITITGGTIIATGGGYDAENAYEGGAGIGSGYKSYDKVAEVINSITITGGDITAYGKDGGAGIGSGSSSHIGDISIANATVKAFGSAYHTETTHNGAAGIGSGQSGTNGNITITSGTIEATGSTNGTGIGSSYNSTCGLIRIDGGEITAIGGNETIGDTVYAGAGIGFHQASVAGTVQITGGTITATGGIGCAGIGGSVSASVSDGLHIAISGGTITATGGYDQNVSGAGIGGDHDMDGVVIDISGGVILSNGSGGSADIGGGKYGENITVTISGGTVSAIGELYTDETRIPGIGGGYMETNVVGSATFTTGENGHAFILTDTLTDGTEETALRGVIFLGTTGKVYGDEITLTEDFTIPKNHLLTIGDGQKLIVLDGVTMVQNGTIENNGIFQYEGIVYYGDFNVTGGTYGEDFQYNANTLTVLTETSLILTTPKALSTFTGKTYKDAVVTAPGVEAYLTLDNLNINIGGRDNTSALEVSHKANITLVGKNTLQSGSNRAGLQTNAGAMVVINGEGSLTANGGNYGAGIGCGHYEDNPASAGAIHIHGGTITANGSTCTAGIGGSDLCGIEEILITGGTIEANGASDGAGIGGGRNSAVGTITITGGNITADSGTSGAAGIGGGGENSGVGLITISGGTIDADASTTSTSAIGPGKTVDANTPFPMVNGNAFIITDEKGIYGNSDDWSGVIFLDKTGSIYGENITLSTDATIPKGYTLTIPLLKTLTIPEDVVLTNKGSIVKYGTLVGEESIQNTNSGTIADGPVYMVYFQNDIWSQVNIHMWNQANDDAPTAWPGIAMESEGANLYSFAVPTMYTSISFNDGSSQTVDIDTITPCGKYAVGDVDGVGKYTVTVEENHNFGEDNKCTFCQTPVAEMVSVKCSLGEDIKMHYYVLVHNQSIPQIQFTINDYTKTVDGEVVGSYYKFVFDGVAPQWIGDTVLAELFVDDKIVENKEYSVFEYLKTLKSRSASQLSLTTDEYSALQTLVADLLIYGGAAQNYTGHKTNALVSEGVVGTVYQPMTAPTGIGVKNGENVQFTGANVWFDSVNKLAFRFQATDLDNYTFQLKINDGTEAVIDPANIVNNGEGTYTILTNAIKAVGFDDKYTITVYNSEQIAEAKIVYSVQYYVYTKQNGEGYMADLAKATYNYGLSAIAYGTTVA